MVNPINVATDWSLHCRNENVADDQNHPGDKFSGKKIQKNGNNNKGSGEAAASCLMRLIRMEDAGNCSATERLGASTPLMPSDGGK